MKSAAASVKPVEIVTLRSTQIKRSSMMLLHPERLDILVLIAAAGTLLYYGLEAPILRVNHMVFFKDTFSVMSSIECLYRENEYFLAAVIFFFSVIFPIAKLALLLGLWILPMRPGSRTLILSGLKHLGKWSMLDVFIVAIMIVAAKLAVFATADPQPGIYYFGASILISMFVTMMVDFAAKRSY